MRGMWLGTTKSHIWPMSRPVAAKLSQSPQRPCLSNSTARCEQMASKLTRVAK